MADTSESISPSGDQAGDSGVGPGAAHEIGLLGSLRDSSLQRFVTATILWGTAHQLVTVSQGYLLFALTESTLWLAALGAAVGIPNVIVAVLGGLLADRVSRKRLLIAGSTIAGLPMLAVTVLYAVDALEPWHLLIAGAAQGSALALDWIARLSLLPDVVPKNTIVRAISIDQTAFNGARVVAPLIGGFILGSLGPSSSYGLITGLFALAIVAYTTFRPRPPAVPTHHVGIQEDFKEVGRVLRSNAILRLNLAFTAVNALMLGGLIFIIPAFAREIFDTDEAGLGYLFAAVGMGAFAGAGTMSWTGGVRRAGYALLVTDVLFGGFVIAWAFSSTLPLALPAAFLLGYFNGVHIALGIAVIQVNVPAEVRGRVLGAYELAWSWFPLGGLASGSLAALVGLRLSLTILAIGLIVFTVTIAVMSLQFRRLRIEGR
ncbi:MAG: MFS transporter [Dehalococcoidia bacterium]|jgi:MFS family permease|nr:MFS transporter [Dehalococcoidia bacterium]